MLLLSCPVRTPSAPAPLELVCLGLQSRVLLVVPARARARSVAALPSSVLLCWGCVVVTPEPLRASCVAAVSYRPIVSAKTASWLEALVGCDPSSRSFFVPPSCRSLSLTDAESRDCCQTEGGVRWFHRLGSRVGPGAPASFGWCREARTSGGHFLLQVLVQSSTTFSVRRSIDALSHRNCRGAWYPGGRRYR